MKNRLIFAALTASMVVLPSCALFTSDAERPVVTQDQNPKKLFPLGDSQYGTAALTASRRMVLFRFGGAPVVCAEPPPVVGEEFSKALKAAAEALVTSKDSEKSAQLQGNILSTLQTTVVRLDKPKGIQYEQDMLFNLCQLAMNGSITDPSVITALYTQIAERSQRILSEEIGNKSTNTTAITSGSIVNKSPLIKLSDAKIQLAVLNAEKFAAYSEIKVVYREVSNPSLAWKETETTKLLNNSIIATLKSNEKYDKPTLLEVSVSLKPRPDSEPMYYPSTAYSVIFPTDLEKALATFDIKDSLISNNPSQIKITLPKYYSIAFPKFSPELDTLVLSYKDSSMEKQIKIDSNPEKLGDDYIYQVRLSDERKKNINDLLANNAVKFSLKYISSREVLSNVDFPEIKELIVAQWKDPGKASNITVTCKPTDSNLAISWKWEGASPSEQRPSDVNYKVYIKENAINQLSEGDKPDYANYDKDSISIDKDKISGKRIFIRPFYQSRLGGAADKKIDVTTDCK